jgi:hypothetical protein
MFCLCGVYQTLSPPKPTGLYPKNFCRQTLNWLWNTNSEKKNSELFFGKNSKDLVKDYRIVS